MMKATSLSKRDGEIPGHSKKGFIGSLGIPRNSKKELIGLGSLRIRLAAWRAFLLSLESVCCFPARIFKVQHGFKNKNDIAPKKTTLEKIGFCARAYFSCRGALMLKKERMVGE